MAIDQQLSDLPQLANLPSNNGNIYLRNDNEANVADKDQRFDLAAKITAMDSAIDSKQAAGSYALATHAHDDRYYTETEVDNLLANVGGGIWTELDAGSLTANTDLTFTGLNSARTLYRMIVVPQSTGSGINVTKAKINDTQHTTYSINTNGTASSTSSQDGLAGGASTWDITIAKNFSQHHILPDQRHFYYGGQYQRWAESSQSSMSSIVWRFNVAVYYKFLKLEL